MTTQIMESRFWRTWGLLFARLIIGGLFFFTAYTKFTGIEATAGYIASVGFPSSVFLAWCAAIFETFLGIGILTGMCFKEASILAGIYILFLAFAFHGPSKWVGSQTEFGFFIDHFTFFAGLLYMAGTGIGESWKLKRFW